MMQTPQYLCLLDRGETLCRHITVDETAGRALYYVLAEPVHSASAPLILWMNGCVCPAVAQAVCCISTKRGSRPLSHIATTCKQAC